MFLDTFVRLDSFLLQAKLTGSCSAGNGSFNASFQLPLDAFCIRPLPLLQQVLYVVVWCAVFSTLHLYITVIDYWVLCLCVSLVSIFLTTAIIFVLHHSNKEVKGSMMSFMLFSYT